MNIEINPKINKAKELMDEKKFHQANGIFYHIFSDENESIEDRLYCAIHLYRYAIRKNDELRLLNECRDFILNSGNNEYISSMYLQDGFSAKRNGNLYDAIELFEKACNSYTNPVAISAIADCYFEDEDYEKAANYYGILMNNPLISANYLNFAFLGIAKCKLIEDKIYSAKKKIKRVKLDRVEITQNELLNYDRVNATILYLEEDYDKAIEVLKNNNDKKSEEEKAWSILKIGLLYLLKRENEEGKKYLIEALEYEWTKELAENYLHNLFSVEMYLAYPNKYSETNTLYRIWENNLSKLNVDSFITFCEELKKLMTEDNKIEMDKYDVYEINYKFSDTYSLDFTIYTIKNAKFILDIIPKNKEEAMEYERNMTLVKNKKIKALMLTK